MPKRIPIKAARDIATAHNCRQVIVLAFDDQGRTHVVTYGRSVKDCQQAAEGGNRLKRAMGWPEADCNAQPARAKKPRKLLTQRILDLVADPHFHPMTAWNIAGALGGGVSPRSVVMACSRLFNHGELKRDNSGTPALYSAARGDA